MARWLIRWGMFFLVILPLSKPLLAQEEGETLYFEENLDDGIPAEWQSTGVWLEEEEGIVRAKTDGASVIIPGQRADFTLAMRLLGNGPGLRSIVFRAQEAASYQLHIRPEGIGLFQTDDAGIARLLKWLPDIHDEEWHELVIIAEGTRIFALWDDEQLFDYEADPDQALYEGTIGFYNLGNGEFVVDSLTIAPIVIPAAILAPKWVLSQLPVLELAGVQTRTPVPTARASEIRYTLNGAEEDLSIVAGECVELQWDVRGAREIYFQEERTLESGYWRECLSETTSFTLRVVQEDGSSTQRVYRVRASQPTPSPTATNQPFSAIPSGGECVLTPVRLNMNLREGDGTDYPVVGRLNFGARARVLGRNLADTWYRVDYNGLDAWIAGNDYTRLEGDCSYVLLQTYAPPEPPPTATPVFVPSSPQFTTNELRFTVNGLNQVYIRAGQCVTLRWYAESIREIYYQGVGVAGPAGERQECPTQSTTYHLRVVLQDGNQRDLYATVTVN